MGEWSTSITGNDTAADLRSEYNAAFFYNDVPTALEKIESYVREHICNEDDKEEWCNYVYSLADYMWKKGILTDEIKERALNMIDSGFGLEIWSESGERALKGRKYALEKFRAQIISPQPAKKKIKVDAHLENVFNDGDIIAFQLQTAGKKYAASYDKPLTEEEFHALDGKYVVVQKISGYASWQSAIEPAVKDWWLIMRLFDGVYNDPSDFDLSTASDAAFSAYNEILPLFSCESSLFHFKRRKYVLLGNDTSDIEKYSGYKVCNVMSMGANYDHYNTDSCLVGAIGKTLVIKQCDDADTIKELWGYISASLVTKESGVSMLDYYKLKDDAKLAAVDGAERSLSEGARYFIAEFGNPVGLICVKDKRLEQFGLKYHFRGLGYGTKLLRYAAELVGDGVYMDVPSEDEILLHVCEKAGFISTDGSDKGYIRMIR